MKKAMLAAALAISALAAGPVAQAGGVHLGISIGVPGIIVGGPAYYYPPPPPPPVYYYGPPSVIVAPRPIYGPAPGYYYGWRGWRGHSHYNRHVAERWNHPRGHRGHGR